MFRINEIFYSLQGEGFHTGTPAVFVRFSGCNLRCTFCDTQHQAGEMMSLQEVVNEVNKYPHCDELKVVYLGQDLAQYDGIEAKYRFLQPCFVEDSEQRKANMQACVEAVKRHPNWRLSLQIHRVLNIP